MLVLAFDTIRLERATVQKAGNPSACGPATPGKWVSIGFGFAESAALGLRISGRARVGRPPERGPGAQPVVACRVNPTGSGTLGQDVVHGVDDLRWVPGVMAQLFRRPAIRLPNSAVTPSSNNRQPNPNKPQAVRRPRPWDGRASTLVMATGILAGKQIHVVTRFTRRRCNLVSTRSA